MKLIIIALNIIFFAPIYSQNLDYNKYESSKNEDLSYKVYLDSRDSNYKTSLVGEKKRSLFISSSNFKAINFADNAIGNYAYRKNTGEWSVGSLEEILKQEHSSLSKTGVWNYYFNGKLKEKSNYFMGARFGPTYLYYDSGKISDTLYYDTDFVDGKLNLDKMSNYLEYLRNEELYSQITSNFEDGRWVERLYRQTYFVGKKNRNNKRDGIWKVYKYKKLIEVINYVNGVRNGKHIKYYDTGEINCLLNYKNGFIDGDIVFYYKNGKVESITNCKQNIIIGKVITIDKNDDRKAFFENGLDDIEIKNPAILLRIKKFKNPNTPESLKLFNDEKFESQTPSDKPNEEDKNITYTNKTPESENNDVYNSAGVDKYPSFIGSNGDLNAYVNENFNNKNINGKIFISFVIEKNGSLTSIKVVRDLGEGSGDEIIRILSLCENCWSPAEIKGKKVRCIYSSAITINN